MRKKMHARSISSIKETVDHLFGDALAVVNYRRSKVAIAEAAMKEGEGLFQGCHDGIGNPLAGDARLLIDLYLLAPTQQSWLDIRGIEIVGRETLWHAWCRFDRQAPRSGDVGHPKAEILRHVIRAAVEENLAAARARLDEISP